MNTNILKLPTLKEIETDLVRTRQKTYAELFKKLLIELDGALAIPIKTYFVEYLESCYTSLRMIFSSPVMWR